jgi:hypothetical protein
LRYQTNERKKMIDKSNWVSYPFTADGVEFVSIVNPKSSIYPQISKLPPAIFSQMNEEAIRSLIGKVSLLSRSEIQDELDRVNQGYGQAYLALA